MLPTASSKKPSFIYPFFSEWKYSAIAAAGFGLGGALWGWEAYRGTVGAGEAFTNPFSYVLGAIFLGVFGGLALAAVRHLQRSSTGLGMSFFISRQTLLIVGVGTIGWLVAFVVPAIGVYWLFLIGSGILPFLLAIFTIPLGVIGANNVIDVGLSPSLLVGNLWLEFLITGVIAGLFYARILKANVLKMMLRGGLGFAFASVSGPILGNLIGDAVDVLFVSYIVTFLIIGVVIGKFFVLALFKNSTVKKLSSREGIGPQ